MHVSAYIASHVHVVLFAHNVDSIFAPDSYCDSELVVDEEESGTVSG